MQPNTLYPLKSPDWFDDDYGTGYDHVLLPDDEPLPAHIRVADMWIMNAAGEKHPGIDESPVPVLLEDIHTDRPVSFSGKIPERGGWGWR